MDLIVERLVRGETVNLSGLGSLSLRERHAQVDAGREKITPPTLDLFFEYNESIEGEEIFRVFSERWKESLERDGSLLLPGLGSFALEHGTVSFTRDEALLVSDDFFGFQEVRLCEPERKKGRKNTEKKILLLSFLFVLLAVLAFGVFRFWEDRVAFFSEMNRWRDSFLDLPVWKMLPFQ